MTTEIAALVAENIDIWTSAIQRKSGAGRGGGKRISLYGIERLRALILDLAVRGKLVPQDASDEPAVDIIKEIKAERSRLIASGKAKQGKLLAVPSEWPFEIPDTWSWSQLGYVTNYGQTEKADPGSVSPETWVLELEDVEKGTSHLLERVRCADKPFQSQKNAFQVGDVIYGKLRPYLDKVIIADEPGVCTTEMVPMRGYAGVRSDYIRLFLKTPFFIAMASDAAHGMNLPRLATEKAREAPFALPPPAEQRRIVAKVDELMALCDALERESAGAMAAHQALVEALLAALVNSADAADLARQWARMESHFDTLFTTDASIEALKQTILDLAVRGKLVEQDAGDEAARDALAELEKIKSQLIRKGHLKRPKVTSPLDSSEHQFRMPPGWAAVRFGEAVDVRDGTHDSPKDAVGPDTFPLVTSKDFKDGKIDFSTSRRISAKDHNVIVQRSFVERGDILFSMIGGNIGNQVMVDVEEQFSIKNVALFKYFSCEITLPRYVKIFTENLADRLQGEASGGAQPFVSLGYFRNLFFPLPPVAEQRRIVAKVDALMALCDALKARLADAAQTQRHLADAITQRAAA